MRGEKKEHWLGLCEQAAQEQDPDKLMDLVKEITRLLDEKQERLRGADVKESSADISKTGSQAGNGQKQ